MNTTLEVLTKNGIHDGSKHDAKVLYSTTDYDQFSYHESNRPINWDHVEALHDAIEKNNMLASYPIVVDANMVVYDGQHRLEAAKVLEVPIFYVISDSTNILDIATANANTRGWSMDDYLHHYCKVGKPEYLKAREYLDRHPFLSTSTAAKVLASKDGVHRLFRMGDFKITRPRFAEKFASAIEDLKKYVDFYHHTNFQRAMVNLLLNPNYDHSILMTRLEYLSSRLVRCADTESYIEVINDIYNHRTREQNRTQLRVLRSPEMVNRWD